MSAQPSVSERNKQIVIRFYNALAQADEATVRALGRPDYIQHNPSIETGLESIINHFIRNRPPGTVQTAPLEFAHVLADGDYVVTIRRIAGRGGPPGQTPAGPPPPPDVERANIDLWRVQDGKVAEHADYMEQFPRGSDPPKNSNGRFF
jgi:predicted SnoaL-like aldol condensation-catalyzing enzyme